MFECLYWCLKAAGIDPATAVQVLVRNNKLTVPAACLKEVFEQRKKLDGENIVSVLKNGQATLSRE